MPDGAFCPRHPDSESVATCQRCGTFVCEHDVKRLVNGVFCEACAVRPEIAYLETLKQKHWGHRDAWAWLFGLSGVAALFAAFLVAMSTTTNVFGRVVWAGGLVGYAVLGIAFWLRVKLARLGLAALFGVLAIVLLVEVGPVSLVSLLLPGGLLVSMLTDVRTKLFFRIDVSSTVLEREWRRQYDNPLARSALSLGIGSFFVPFFAPIALVTSVIALLRVNPKAQPPIGGRGRAIAGLVLGLLGGLFWFGIIAAQLSHQ
ncbi:MAG: hypothetical protein ABTQ32_08525 [Myxococcaceae bacterium]